jgi:hypothetical protein
MKIFGVAVGLAGLLVAGSANAGLLPGNPLFSSFVTNSLDANSVALHTGGPSQGGSPDAQEFTAASTVALQSLTFRLSDPTPGDGGSLLVYLVPNNATPSLNIPSSTGLTLNGAVKLGTILDSALGTTAGNTTLQVYDLISAGTYWIALVNGSNGSNGGNSDSPSTNALWYRTGDLIGLDVGNNVGNTTAGLFNAHVAPAGTVLTSVTGNSFELQINTPEPASLALLGAGMTALGFIRRRRAKKAGR